MMASGEAVRRIEPLADGLQSFDFGCGAFDRGGRGATPLVEGVIRCPDPILLVTLRGGARRLTVRTDAGHVHQGPDFAGAVSFVPAGCERRLTLEGVDADWASLTLDADAFAAIVGDGKAPAPFTNVQDPFLASLLGEMERASREGMLDAAYGEAMAVAAAHHLGRRARPQTPTEVSPRLSPARLRRLRDYVEARLDRPITVSELAAEAGLSVGHLHRSLKASVGVTPLRFLQELRVRRATGLLADGVGVTETAFRVGFASPSHFARIYRRLAGRNPGEARRR